MTNTTHETTWRRRPARWLRAALAWRPDRLQRRLALVAVPVFALDLYLASQTKGTFDVTIWRSFAASVDRVGPIKIYSLPLHVAGLMVYNHPPLAGWWLVIVNALSRVGIDLGTTMRAATSVAHLVTVYLVLAILRRRISDRWALLSAIAVAVSPVMIIVSGFHGNNDPTVAMLTIAAVYLLVDRRWPVAAGVAFSLAISIKIIPIIALPLLLVAAWALGRRRDLVRLALGGLPVFVLFWVPVLIWARAGFLANVLGYNGSGFPRQWGLYEGAKAAGVSQGLLDFYAGAGTYLVLALCALLPAWFIRRQPMRAPAALGLSMAMFLLLTPGWAFQYGVYAAAAVFFVEFWSALVVTAGSGAVYVVFYYHWRGDVQMLTHRQIPLLFVAWLSMIPSVVVGLRTFLRRGEPTENPRPTTLGTDPALPGKLT
jgi:hypothetical protein